METTHGIQSGKRVTHRLQKGWSTYLATTERSSPLYLYRFSVSTPCAPINPILLGRVHRRASRGRSGGCSEMEGTGWSRSSGRAEKGTRLRRGLESGGVAAVVPRAGEKARRSGSCPRQRVVYSSRVRVWRGARAFWVWDWEPFGSDGQTTPVCLLLKKKMSNVDIGSRIFFKKNWTYFN